MKKLIALLLVLVMFASLAACSKTSSTSSAAGSAAASGKIQDTLKLALRNFTKPAATAGTEVAFTVQAIEHEIVLPKNQDLEITIQIGNEILENEFIVIENRMISYLSFR